MKQIKYTPNISVLMEKMYVNEDENNSPIIETKKIGDKMYAIISEGSRYVIKYAPFVEGKKYKEHDFKYINGIQNREKYLSETIVFAKKKLNFILNESIHSGGTKKENYLRAYPDIKKYILDPVKNNNIILYKGSEPIGYVEDEDYYDGQNGTITLTDFYSGTINGTDEEYITIDILNVLPLFKQGIYKFRDDSEDLYESEKYVIKKDTPNPEPAADVDLDVDDADVDINGDEGMEDEAAEDIETDLDEYQELTGKLSYILRNQDEGQYDDVSKYIFNSLFAAWDIDKMDSNVASSIKEKFLAKFENSNEEKENGDAVEETLSRIEEPYQGEKHRHVNTDSVIDQSLMEGQLKKKGYQIVEKFSKEGLIAFMGAKDVSGVFNQPTKRYEDGEMKNPHEKEGIHPIGDSQPYDKNNDPNEMNQKNKDKPFVEGMQWEDYTEDYGDLEIAAMDQEKKKNARLNTWNMPSASGLGYDADKNFIEDDPYPASYDEPSLEELLADEFLNV